jgi:hypothetical protein
VRCISIRASRGIVAGRAYLATVYEKIPLQHLLKFGLRVLFAWFYDSEAGGRPTTGLNSGGDAL